MPPRWQRFVWQLLEWTAAVLVARTICGSVVRKGACVQAMICAPGMAWRI